MRLKARWMSLTEYRRTTGRPCGQLMGQSVLANSCSSHSILFCSSGMLTLMAAWQAMVAAMWVRIFSRLSDCSSRSNCSRISCSMCSTSAALMPAAVVLTAMVRVPKGSTSDRNLFQVERLLFTLELLEDFVQHVLDFSGIDASGGGLDGYGASAERLDFRSESFPG